MKKKGKYLGEILVEKGLITEQELQKVIEEQLKNKKFLGMMLVDKGLITEDELLATLAEQFDIEPVHLKGVDIDWEGAFEFPSALIVGHKCFPLHGDGETLTLAITNPLDVWVVDNAEKEVAPRKLKVVLIKASDMDEAVKEYRRRSVQKMMKKWKKK